jgi:spore coat protein CotH
MAVLVLAVWLLAAGCGGTANVPADVASGATPTSAATVSPSFLSGDTIHDISVEFAQADYDDAIAAYQADQSKEWIAATVTVDGAVYESAGIRLKGNSSLFALGGDNARRGPGGNADSSSPETLPWLIRLDKYVEGQNHDGISDIVVRSNNTTTALNEAVALDLLEEAGLASQDSAYAAFSVNGSDTVLRLVMELPEDTWMATTFSDDGILYKAEATGDYSYRGDNPESYTDVFDVEGGEDDLSPLIEFLDFINNSTDEAFYAELNERLDTGSFATYLAAQELIANSDDIDGRGNNSYLYLDASTGQFTVVPWDHNGAFAGGGAAGGGAPIDNGRLDTNAANAVAGVGDLAQGGPSRGRGAPQDQTGGPGADLPGPGLAEVSNVLVDRFLANADYAALYQSELDRLATELYDSGTASGILDNWVSLLEGSELITDDVISTEAAAISRYFG